MTGASAEISPPAPMSFATISGALFIGTVALTILAILPILLGAFVEHGLVATDQVGMIGTGEMVAIALASALGPKFLRQGRVRSKIVAASVGLAIADAATGICSGAVPLLTVRVSAGLFEGLMMGSTIVMMLRGRQPERLNGLFLAVSAIPQAVGAYLLPTVLLPRFGISGSFDLLSLLALLSAAAAMFMRLEGDVAASPTSSKLRWTIPIAVTLGAIFLQQAADMTAWTYVELIAKEHGFSPLNVAVATSGALVMQVVGSFLVAWVGWRLALRRTLVACALAQMLILVVVALSHSPALYTVNCLAFGMLWLAVIPFQFRLLIQLDPSGTAASSSVALNLLGQSVGPLIGTFGVRGTDVVGAFWIAAALMGICAILFWFVAATKPLRGAVVRVTIDQRIDRPKTANSL